jgi:hypothetical protein
MDAFDLTGEDDALMGEVNDLAIAVERAMAGHTYKACLYVILRFAQRALENAPSNRQRWRFASELRKLAA